MSTSENSTRLTVQEALANICRKTGMSPAEILKAFDSLVLMGYADKHKLARIKKHCEEIDPDRFH